jgi:hypothetical protein
MVLPLSTTKENCGRRTLHNMTREIGRDAHTEYFI